ncbi:putative helix-turn-helix domain-containing protein [Hafnia phage vB_HpaM_Meifeng]|nr:putative helix-turn-helix domain-containing protein [Hafnia phage vB_HpaM_Meifeng]
MDEQLLKLSAVAKRLNVSTHTIYRNPAKFNMFKVGGSWRAREESLASFSSKVNNAIRLGVVGKESMKCRSSREEKYTGSISPLQTERELDALLAPRKKRKLRSTTTN